jgi:hypothetical protein
MKHQFRWHFGFLLLVNCWVATAVALSAHQAAHHWNEIVPGTVPLLTAIALQGGPLVSLAFLLLSLAGFAMAILDRGGSRLQSFWFPVLVMAELTLLALFTIALIYPSFTILYRLGGNGA